MIKRQPVHIVVDKTIQDEIRKIVELEANRTGYRVKINDVTEMLIRLGLASYLSTSQT